MRECPDAPKRSDGSHKRVTITEEDSIDGDAFVITATCVLCDYCGETIVEWRAA